jgi:hypothetical protein
MDVAFMNFFAKKGSHFVRFECPGEGGTERTGSAEISTITRRYRESRLAHARAKVTKASLIDCRA